MKGGRIWGTEGAKGGRIWGRIFFGGNFFVENFPHSLYSLVTMVLTGGEVC
jgi:hypothetical protein